MKKVLWIIAATALVANVHAADDAAASEATDEISPIGVGIQGTFMSDGFGNVILVPAASVRWAPDALGGQIVAGRTSTESSTGGGAETENRYTLIQGKLFFSVIERENSCFYIGGQAGVVRVEQTGAGGNWDVDTFAFGALVGSEFRFEELPELGFNFEIAYGMGSTDAEGFGPDSEVDFGGLAVTVGTHYYF
jgi:hypothetical protein